MGFKDRALGINKLIDDAADVRHRDNDINDLESGLGKLEEEIENVISNINQ